MCAQRLIQFCQFTLMCVCKINNNVRLNCISRSPVSKGGHSPLRSTVSEDAGFEIMQAATLSKNNYNFSSPHLNILFWEKKTNELLGKRTKSKNFTFGFLDRLTKSRVFCI
jgi:hypothetical protein